MNLYKISRTDGWGYDDYDSAVVVAESAEAAIEIHPSGGIRERNYDWPNEKGCIKAELIGVADPSLKAGEVVCASFNAG